jgi:hypothetical protein
MAASQKRKKLVQGCCKGLVEVRSDSLKDIEEQKQMKPVVFVHRNVPEYLRDKAANLLFPWTRDFKPEAAIAQLLLAELRCTDESFVLSLPWFRLTYVILEPQFWETYKQTAYEVLDYFELEIKTKISPLETDDSLPTLFNFSGLSLKLRDNQDGSTKWVLLHQPVYMMARRGGVDYVTHRISKDRNLLEDDFSRSILLSCLLCSLERDSYNDNLEEFINCLDRASGYKPSMSLYGIWGCAIMVYVFQMGSKVDPVVGLTITTVLRNVKDPQLRWVTLTGKVLDSSRIAADSQGDVNFTATWRGVSVHEERLVHPYYHYGVEFLLYRGDAGITLPELIEFWDFENKSEIFDMLGVSMSDRQELRVVVDSFKLAYPLKTDPAPWKKLEKNGACDIEDIPDSTTEQIKEETEELSLIGNCETEESKFPTALSWRVAIIAILGTYSSPQFIYI